MHTVGMGVMRSLLTGGYQGALLFKKRVETSDAVFYFFSRPDGARIPAGVDARRHFCGNDTRARVFDDARVKMSYDEFWEWFSTGKATLINGALCMVAHNLLCAGCPLTYAGRRVHAVRMSGNGVAHSAKEVVHVFGHAPPVADATPPQIGDYPRADVDRLQHRRDVPCDDMAGCDDADHLAHHQMMIMEMCDGGVYGVDMTAYQLGSGETQNGIPWTCKPLEDFSVHLDVTIQGGVSAHAWQRLQVLVSRSGVAPEQQHAESTLQLQLKDSTLRAMGWA